MSYNFDSANCSSATVESIFLQEQPLKVISLAELSDALQIDRDSHKAKLETWLTSFSERLQVKLVSCVSDALGMESSQSRTCFSPRRSRSNGYVCNDSLSTIEFKPSTSVDIGSIGFDDVELEVPNERWSKQELWAAADSSVHRLPPKSAAVQTYATCAISSSVLYPSPPRRQIRPERHSGQSGHTVRISNRKSRNSAFSWTTQWNENGSRERKAKARTNNIFSEEFFTKVEKAARQSKIFKQQKPRPLDYLLDMGVGNDNESHNGDIGSRNSRSLFAPEDNAIKIKNLSSSDDDVPKANDSIESDLGCASKPMTTTATTTGERSTNNRKAIFDGTKQEEVLNNLRQKVLHHERRLRKFSTQIVNHRGFDALCAFMIMGNSILIGVSTQHGINHTSSLLTLEVLGHFFSAYFLLELLLRMDSLGAHHFFCGDDNKWNWFDFILVTLSAVDLIISLASPSEDETQSTRSLKTIKMLRIMRVFRIFRFFSDLSLLTVLIAHSLKSLMWSLVLIALIIYVFGILFTQVATMSLREGWTDGRGTQKYFGSLDRSIYHLVCAMMGGISWIEMGDVVLGMGVIASVLFFFFISFMILAVLNIINAVFVDNAIQTANSEREFMVQRELDLKAGYVGELISVFNELDADHSGDISWEELQHFFLDQRVQVYFEAMGISGNDLKRLWELLDEDKSGSVGLHEFLDGCIRFKGNARSIDMHFVLQYCKKLDQDIETIMSEVQQILIRNGDCLQ